MNSRLRCCLAAFAVMLNGSLFAQQARLVADLLTIPTADSPNYESVPLFSASNGSITVFTATDPVHGREFWATDGTPEGTFLLADIGRGEGGAVLDVRSSIPAGTFAPVQLGPGGRFLLCANGMANRTNGAFLWSWSPGEALPTPILTQSATATISSTSFFGALAGSRFFFVVGRGSSQTLWTTDGTAQGTVLIKDFAPLTPSISDIRRLSPAGNRVFFSCGDVTSGFDPWVSDGTTPGTYRITDLPGTGTSNATQFAQFGDRVFFPATDQSSGTELWVTDGTAAGTRLHADIVPGTASSSPLWPTVSLGSLWFIATGSTTGVYRISEPTAAPTLFLPGASLLSNRAYPPLVESGGLLYIGDTGGLRRTDGTADGTFELTGFWFGEGDVVSNGVPVLLPYRNADGTHCLMFRAHSSSVGRELWSTDGTQAGTTLVMDIWPGSSSSSPIPLGATSTGAVLAVDGPVTGVELWTSAGTSGSTSMLRDISRRPQGSLLSSMVEFNGGIYVYANGDGVGAERWRTDGTSASLCEESTFGPTGLNSPSSAAAGSILMTTSVELSSDIYVYRLRGSNSGFRFGQTLAEFRQSSGSGRPVLFAPAPVGCVFSAVPAAPSTDIQRRLWRSDGTPEGTFRVPYPASISPYNITHFIPTDTRTFFIAPSSSIGGSMLSLYSTDGSTVSLLSHIGETSSFMSPSRRLGNRELIVGTVNGSRGLFSFEIDQPNPTVGRLASVGTGSPVVLADFVLFADSFPLSNGGGLWRSDGTSAGTLRFWSDAPVSSPLVVALDSNHSNVAYFTQVSSHGRELWLTDGTAAGTRMVVDLWPGPASSEPGLLTAVDGRLFFTANRGDTGYELWTSDGTTAGTTLVADIVPGPASAGITFLKASGGRLYFDPVAPDIGRELWTVYVSGRYCDADHNADGEVNADDLGDYINCYFALPPCEDLDFNRDGEPNADDLADYINAFFAGCA